MPGHVKFNLIVSFCVMHLTRAPHVYKGCQITGDAVRPLSYHHTQRTLKVSVGKHPPSLHLDWHHNHHQDFLLNAVFESTPEHSSKEVLQALSARLQQTEESQAQYSMLQLFVGL